MMLNNLLEMHPLDQKIALKQAVMSLTPKMQHVIMRRFYQNQTLASIGDELGVSGVRVRQIEAKAIRILRHGFIRNRM